MEDTSQKPGTEEAVPACCPKCGSRSVQRTVQQSVQVQESYTDGVLRDTLTVRVVRSRGSSTQWQCVPGGHTWYDPPRTGTLYLKQDEDPMSPREHDNLGIIICLHGRYNLGDDHDYKACQFDGWVALREHLEKAHEAIHILPLYLMDHSGLSLQTEPFGCGWDSGQVGFVFTTAKRMEELGVTEDDVEECLRSEVKVYSQYLEGDVWGYILRDSDGETIDSCWGFYGAEDAEQEGRAAAKAEEVELTEVKHG